MKPLNPTEPLFPHRPDEPVCQYFLKHGTCKFGQACKFDHPPQHAIANNNINNIMINNTMQLMDIHNNNYRGLGVSPNTMMNMLHMGQQQQSMPPQLVLHNNNNNSAALPRTATDAMADGMILQFLPQRVEEPDCIYFLKNGRCKYGATCRYHHPVHPHHSQQQQQISTRRVPVDMHKSHNNRTGGGGGGSEIMYDSRTGQKVQYVTTAQMGGVYPRGQQQQQQQPSTIHSYDSSNNNFIHMDRSTNGQYGGPQQQQAYQIVSGTDGVPSYYVPAAGSVAVTEQGSSSSSIASSSYETTTAQQQDHLMMEQQWGRVRRNGSAGSLSGYAVNTSNNSDNGGGSVRIKQQQRTFLSHSISEGNIIHRQSRSTSYGSAIDMAPTISASAHSLPRNMSVGSWNNNNNRMIMMQQQVGNAFVPRPDSSRIAAALAAPGISPVASQQQRRIPMRRRDPRSGEGPGDEGFTMMTSALLHMLDTPEDAVVEQYSDEEFRFQQQDSGQDYLDNCEVEIDYNMFGQMSLQDPSASYEMGSPQGEDFRVSDGRLQANTAPFVSSTQQLNHSNPVEMTSSWSPTWLGAVQGPDHTTDGFSLIHHKTRVASTTSSHDSNVGLYLT